MGRELQKKKRRSGIAKARPKQKSRKAVLSNPFIAANWDSTQTLDQNYRRLGLVNKLNRMTGGVDRTPTAGGESGMIPISEGTMVIAPQVPVSQALHEAKVVRDPKTGEILRVVDGARPNPLNDPLNDLDSDEEDFTATQHNISSSKRSAKTSVVAQLEAQAAVEGKKKPRTQSEREQEWIAALVAKHGDDYSKMWRDMKLNPMQQSEGDLRKRVEKWKRSQKAV